MSSGFRALPAPSSFLGWLWYLRIRDPCVCPVSSGPCALQISVETCIGLRIQGTMHLRAVAHARNMGMGILRQSKGPFSCWNRAGVLQFSAGAAAVGDETEHRAPIGFSAKVLRWVQRLLGAQLFQTTLHEGTHLGQATFPTRFKELVACKASGRPQFNVPSEPPPRSPETLIRLTVPDRPSTDHLMTPDCPC